MPGDKEAPKQGIEVGLDRKRIARVLTYRPSRKELKKHEKLQQKLAQLREKETEEKETEAADEYLKQSLTQLNEEQAGTYEETVGTAVEEVLSAGDEVERKEGIRFQIVRSVLTQRVFKERYGQWKKEFQREAKDPEFDMTEEEFVVERGVAFILKHRNLLVRGRLSHQLDAIGPKEEEEEQEKQRREKIETEVFVFIEAHEDEILSGEADEEKLRAEFVKIFLENGHAEQEREVLEQLFDDVIGDIEYAAIIREQFEATSEELMVMTYLDLTEEEWEKRLADEFKDNAKGKVKETLEQMITPVFTATAPAPLGEVPYASVREIGNASGVHFRRVNVAGQGNRNLYMVDFPYLKDAYRPLMEISFPAGTRDLAQATYTIEDPSADPGLPNTGRPLREKTINYRVSQLPVVMARIQLDYELLRSARDSGDNGLTPEYINNNLNDKDLRHMAERLLDFQFKDKPLLPPHMNRCKNLFAVLAKPDGSFPERVKRMKEALDDDSLVPYIRKILDSNGSRIMNVSSAIESAESERGGVKVG